MVFQDKMEATKGLVADEKINHMRVLWQKGRNMFQSFMTEAETIKKQINDDELFAAWCLWQLHISITPITEASAFLRKDDADRVKAEFASAGKADKAARDAEAHKEKLAKIAKQNEIVMAQILVAEQKAALKAKLEPEPPKAKPVKPAVKADKKPTRKSEKTNDQLERLKVEILADPTATRDTICERARVTSHALEQKAHSQLEQQGLVLPRNTGWTKGPPKPDDYMLYNGYVEAGKAAANHQWTLGDLAISVTALKSYGEAKLANYADDVGVEHGTLKRYRDVSKAWSEKAIRIANWSVCMVLSTHPDRVTIVAADPSMTVAKAREIMDAWKATTNVVTLRGA